MRTIFCEWQIWTKIKWKNGYSGSNSLFEIHLLGGLTSSQPPLKLQPIGGYRTRNWSQRGSLLFLTGYLAFGQIILQGGLARVETDSRGHEESNPQRRSVRLSVRRGRGIHGARRGASPWLPRRPRRRVEASPSSSASSVTVAPSRARSSAAEPRRSKPRWPSAALDFVG